MAVCLLLGGMVFVFRNVHSFLAVSQPVAAEVLVIEGWIPDYALRQCVPLIKSGKYRRVVTVGGPVSGIRPPAADDDTHAYVAARFLQKLKLGEPAVEMAPTKIAPRDRTFRCASDLEIWLRNQKLGPRAIDVATLGPHARRTRLLFEKALGDEVKVGVIALESAEYEADEWWRYSEGVREVISESTAYLYARLLFRP